VSILVAFLDTDGAATASGLVARIAAEAAGYDAELLVLLGPRALRDERALRSLLRERPAGPRVAVAELLPGVEAVPAANVALGVARACGRGALLLPAGAVPRPSAIAEMIAVATLDPMIGFVGARSDDGDIANSPYPAAYRPRDAEAAWRNHAAIARHLPRFTFVPTLPPSGLLVAHAMLREFGLFDEAYGDGPHHQHDLIRRCNRCGYRAVLANQAYVARASPLRETEGAGVRNGRLLNRRYPEFHRATGYYFGGADYRAQAAMAGLVPDDEGRLRVLFDGRMLRPFHNGTFEHAVKLVTAFKAIAGDRYAVSLLADADAFAFHGLDRVTGVTRHVDDSSDPRAFAIAFRLGQPFIREDLVALADRAPLTGVLMLDTIALDCQQITDADLDTLWRTMTDTVHLIGYNSEASQAQFRRRFHLTPAVHDFVSRCATDLTEYCAVGEAPGVEDGGVLLVGNRYAHKHVASAFAALRARPERPAIRVLGVEAGWNDAVARHALGDLPQATVAGHYRAADVVLFPSHYEGFGLPILHALAAGTPIVARDLPPAREIAARTRHAANIHLVDDSAEMAALAAAPPAWDSRIVEAAHPPESWADAAAALAAAFDTAIARFDYHRCVARESRLVALRTTLRAEGEVGAAVARAGDAESRAEDAEERRNRADRDRDEAARGRDDALHVASQAETARAAAERAAMLARYGVGDAWDVGDAAPLVAALRASIGRHEGNILRWLAARLPVRRRCDARLGDPPRVAGAAPLRLDARGSAPGDPAFTPRLLDWARAVEIGGTMTLVIRNRADAPGARAALLASGFCPIAAIPAWRRAEIAAVRILDWAAMLPGPEDDALFVTIAFRRALGREPNPLEEAHFRAVLADGTPREAVLAAITASPERPAMIAAAGAYRGL
jgi:hypothetical protein